MLERCIRLWRECDAAPSITGRQYSPSEQDSCEGELKRLLAAVQAELSRLPVTRPERDAARQRITSAFAQFGRAALGFEDRHLDLLLGGGFSAIATDLARRARRYDPRVSMADILQASRNAWTACGLQVLAGERMHLSPAIFAYSMLYPYSDNVVDDPAVDASTRLRFSRRFGQRLRGEIIDPETDIERGVCGLIALIEEQFPRGAFPRVFDSLLAIHHAQERSIRLLHGGADLEVVELSFEKGGTSVVADAYLAAGSPCHDMVAFAFHWGVLLQLGDDLQDLRDDRANGRRTVFSVASMHEPLDAVTSRTLAFGDMVLAALPSLGAPNTETLKELISRSSRSLLVRAAGQASEFYSPEYLESLERFFPFRFGFLNECRRRLGRQSGALARLFEAFLAGGDDEPAFPLLPASLMQHL